MLGKEISVNELKPAHFHRRNLTNSIIACMVGAMAAGVMLLIMGTGSVNAPLVAFVLVIFMLTLAGSVYRFRRWMRCPKCKQWLKVKGKSEHQGATLVFPCNACKVDYDSGLIAEVHHEDL